MIEDVIKEMADNRSKLAERLSFCDANIWMGSPKGFPLAKEMMPSELPAVLARFHINGGLISHWRGCTVSAQEGNAALAEIESELPENCHILCTGLPLYPKDSGILPGLSSIPEATRGVRIFPATHKFELTKWVVGQLCKWLTDRRMPLFIQHTEFNWNMLRELASEFPDLTIIVETQPQKILYHTRTLFPLMNECPNIMLETSNFIGSGFMEFAVREFGGGRLIFGSFLPVNDPLAPMGMLLDANISESDKKLIAGGTLRRIVEEVRL